MAHVLNKEEKLALIETFPCVMNAKDDGTTYQFTRGGEIKYYMGKDYIEFADGVYLEMGKPRLDNEIWYDDEYESPDTNRDIVDVFMDHNMDRNRPSGQFKRLYEFSDHHKFVILYKLNTYSYDSAIFDSDYYHTQFQMKNLEDAGYKRYEITEEDIKVMRDYLTEQDKKYEKRLQTYARRYRDKICCRGYWANR